MATWAPPSDRPISVRGSPIYSSGMPNLTALYSRLRSSSKARSMNRSSGSAPRSAAIMSTLRPIRRWKSGREPAPELRIAIDPHLRLGRLIEQRVPGRKAGQHVRVAQVEVADQVGRMHLRLGAPGDQLGDPIHHRDM